MNFLLDTHIWLWSLLEPRRIRKKLASMLEDPANELWLSPISVWEAMVLAQDGRIEIGPNPDIWIRQALAKGFTREAALTNEIAFQSRLLDIPRKDPADRFLVATALVNGFTLATADEHVLRFRGVRTISNH